MIKKFAFIFTLILSTQGLCQVDEQLAAKRANYQINDYFKAGNYLIYDCFRGYYTCVDEDGFNKCKELRQKDKVDNKPQYSCAQLKKFSDHAGCAKTNYEVIEANAKKRFCYPKNN